MANYAQPGLPAVPLRAMASRVRADRGSREVAHVRPPHSIPLMVSIRGSGMALRLRRRYNPAWILRSNTISARRFPN